MKLLFHEFFFFWHNNTICTHHMDFVRSTRIEYKNLSLGLTTPEAVKEADVEEGRDEEYYNSNITGVTGTKCNSD